MERQMYDVSAQLGMLFEELYAQDGVFDDELRERFDVLEMKFNEKILGLVEYREDLKGDIEKFKAELLRLGNRKKTLENTKKSIERYTYEQLYTANIKKMEAGTFRVWRHKNPSKVIVLSQGEIPDNMIEATLKMPLLKVPAKLASYVTDTRPMLKEIMQAHKAGVKTLGTKIDDKSEHLRVK